MHVFFHGEGIPQLLLSHAVFPQQAQTGAFVHVAVVAQCDHRVDGRHKIRPQGYCGFNFISGEEIGLIEFCRRHNQMAAGAEPDQSHGTVIPLADKLNGALQVADHVRMAVAAEDTAVLGNEFHLTGRTVAQHIRRIPFRCQPFGYQGGLIAGIQPVVTATGAHDNGGARLPFR